MNKIIAAARAAFIFNYHRDLMNASLHGGDPVFSALTVQLADALVEDAGAMSEEIRVVIRTPPTKD